MNHAFLRLFRWRRAALVLAMAVAAGCAGKKDPVPVDPSQADRFLLDRGNEAVAKKKWLDARQYYRQVVENYPQSPLRAEAKIGVGETYLGEHSAESLVLAAAEFREFLNYYPTNPLAARAQYKLAMTYFSQMHPSDRDQTPTREALAEFARFFERFPDSDLVPEALEKQRLARDRLSDASYRIGVTYYKRKWLPGAVSRFRELIKEDPEFSGIDGVYYHLAECLSRADNLAEAIPLFSRVAQTSEHYEKAQKRLKQINAQRQLQAQKGARNSVPGP